MEEEFTGENADLNAVKAHRNAKNTSVDMNFDFTPNNPYQLSVDTEGLGESSILQGNQNKPGFFETAAEEFKDFNASYEMLHTAKNQLSKNYSPAQLHLNEVFKKTLPEFSLNDTSPFEDIAPMGWNPKSDPTKLVNIQPQYLAYAMEATGPKDLEYRLQRINEEQYHDETLANGSMAARVLGGLTGIVTDPMSYIPIAAMAKYGKVAPSFFKNAAKSFPGVATYSLIQSAAHEANKINGNLQDFFTSAAINSVFGSVLFGAAGVTGLSVEKMNLWNTGREFLKAHIDGIDFHLKIDTKGKITGIEAKSSPFGSNTVGAAQLKAAQEFADSSFEKSGMFKLPYIGTALFNLMTIPHLGTPLPKLLNNHYETVRGIVDRFVSHNIITTGIKKGEVAPVRFQDLMDQETSSLRSLHTQVNALRMERMGFDISNRAVRQLTDIGFTLKNKSAELLGKDLEKSDFVTPEQFYDEIQTVLRTRQPNEHAPVNEAAAMFREKIDSTYKAWRKAYDLPEEWIAPNVLEDYLMRVYDTPHLNTHEEEWIVAISNYLKESDDLIMKRMEPLIEINKKIIEHKERHEELIRSGNKSNTDIERLVGELDAIKIKKKSMEETLQNELRENPDMFYHVDDWHALSANEAEEINLITKNRDSLTQEISAQKKEISKIKTESSKRKAQALKGKTVKTATKQLKRSDVGKLFVEKEEQKLRELEEKLYQENVIIQEKLQSGKINPRLYYKEKGSHILHLKNPSERLKFRKTYYETEKVSYRLSEHDAHFARRNHAKAYYDTILNQTAEDTINQVMGKVNGNITENPLKARTLNVPDKLLYDNNFMTKDLMAKTSNYVTYLSRRTNLKTVFNDVTLEGGFEPVLEKLNDEYLKNRDRLIAKKEKLKQSKNENEILKIDKALARERIKFDKAKADVNHIYEKAMGLKKHSRRAKQVQSGIMSMTAWANLAFTPLSMITDLGANGLQHGIWPFIRDGVYPIVESLGGILKTKDSESIRKTAPSVNLALQDVLMGYADKNWSMNTEPYLNLGKVVGTLENIAHFSSNFTLTNYIDNGLQRFAGALSQGEFMRILHAYKEGTMTKSEGLYLRQYGLDYEKWADRMISAFSKDGGGKNKLGGYQSLFWQWQDMEAANEFSKAVYRGIKSTTIQRGLADSPFWADNLLGSLINGFKGWTFASLNRYVIPSMQKSDAQSIMGVIFMTAMGSFVSPMRRLARGEEAFPENQTASHRMYEAFSDSGYFSFFSSVLADANLLSGDRLLGDLKNDKYRDRTRVGLLGPSFGQANRMADVIGAAASGEMNKADLKRMGRMIPVVNSSWTWWMSKKLIEGLDIPETRAQAKAQKNS